MNRRVFVATLASGALATPLYAAGVRSCHQCGSCNHVRKVCRIVCEIEEVKEVVYDCECEDFCIPGPLQKCGCREVCTCGKVRTRRKLVKHEVIKKVPKHKCVVEYLCSPCCNARPAATDHALANESLGFAPYK